MDRDCTLGRLAQRHGQRHALQLAAAQVLHLRRAACSVLADVSGQRLHSWPAGPAPWSAPRAAARRRSGFAPAPHSLVSASRCQWTETAQLAGWPQRHGQRHALQLPAAQGLHLLRAACSCAVGTQRCPRHNADGSMELTSLLTIQQQISRQRVHHESRQPISPGHLNA